MKTDKGKEHKISDVKPEWQGVVKRLLAYAEEKGLSHRAIQLGWSIDLDRTPLIHIEVFIRAVGVVPQFGHMQRWYDRSVLQGLRHRLETAKLFEKPLRCFPIMIMTSLESPEAFSRFCEAFDWFLEQIKK